mmetsp:Transcript_51719/g.83925  ORF Transcript_51719/g.83925 Transcript_51719/m.83925 type:complete len:262 (+) Transcript_51719:103-888(+)
MSASQPDDMDIMAQEREVRAEAEAAPLVGQLLSISVLKEQYATNPGFLPKVEKLESRFRALRRTRPDGNCFYRAYLFGIFEQIAGNKERHAAFLQRAKKSLDFCVGAGYEKVAIEDFYEEFIESVESLAPEGSSASAVEALLEKNDGYLVCWARVLTSAYLKRHKEDYEPFLSSHPSIQKFCAQEVDPMNTEADHLQITALSCHLGVPVCVVYLDRSEGDSAAEHEFQAQGGGSDSEHALTSCQPVHLLYRPGHYDIIYVQ